MPLSGSAFPRSVWLLAGGVVVALWVLGWTIHDVMVPGPEYDGYASAARGLLAGVPEYDGFHPALTSVLIAGLTLVLGVEPFAAGIVLSALAAGMCVLLASRLAWRLTDSLACAWVAAIWVAVNATLWEHGMLVSSDMLFAALATATVLACLSLARERTVSSGFLVGLLAGLLWSTRFAAAAMAPMILLALVLGVRGQQNWWRLLPTTALALLLGAAPQLIVSGLVTGSPLFNRNGDILVLKYAADFDALGLIEADRYPPFFAVLADDPWRVLEIAGTDLLAAIVEQLPVVVGNTWWLGVGLLLLAAAVAWPALRRRHAGAWLMTIGAVATIVAVSTGFVGSARMLLPVAPIVVVAATAALQWSGRKFGAGSRGSTPLVVGLALAVVMAAALPASLERFADRHAREELGVARDLLRDLPGGDLLMMTSNELKPEYPFRLVGRRPLARQERGDAAKVWPRLVADAQRWGARWVLVSRIWDPSVFSVVEQQGPPPYVSIERQDDDLIVLRLRHPEPDHMASARVEASIEPAVVRLRLVVPEPVDYPIDVEFVREDRLAHVPLPRIAPTIFELSLPRLPQSAGTWLLVPRFHLGAGHVVRGALVRLEVSAR